MTQKAEAILDLLNDLAIWLHLMALALGGVASFGIPLTAARIPGSEPSARPALAQVIQVFSKVGSAAIGTLILTGLILVYSKYDGFAGHSPWFYAKLVLVAALIGVIAVNKRLGARAMAGDQQAAGMSRKMSVGGIALLASIVASAVVAFG